MTNPNIDIRELLSALPESKRIRLGRIIYETLFKHVIRELSGFALSSAIILVMWWLEDQGFTRRFLQEDRERRDNKSQNEERKEK